MIEFTMNNGNKIPSLGLGVYRIPSDVCEVAVEYALRHNYRLIDTANFYMNEKAVARGMSKSQLKREDIFLTSKIWPSNFRYEKAKKAINETLERLATPYIDLLLLHQSVGKYKEAYKAMEDAVREGKIKSIGLSNFEGEELKDILDIATFKPVINQVECHPYFQQKELKELSKKEGIILESWYPLGSADKTLLEDPVFVKLANKYNKTVAQVILRWHIEYGNVVIPGSKSPNHIDENIDIFDFELTEEEMKEIASLDKNKRYFNVPRFVQKLIFPAFVMDYNKQK